MAALMIARIAIKDRAKLKDYLTKTKEVARTFGAELLYQGKASRALNGDDDHQLVVIAKFPNLEQIEAWFASPAYRPLAALREEAADMQMTSYQVMG